MLYGIVLWIRFTSVYDYTAVTPPDKEIIIKGLLRVFGAAFLYGAVSAMPAFFISSFCKNPYLITCTPFLIVYLWNTALEKVTMELLMSGKMEESGKLSPYFPDSITYLFMYLNDESVNRRIIIFNSLYVVVFAVLFIVVMNCRKDKGM